MLRTTNKEIKFALQRLHDEKIETVVKSTFYLALP